MRFNLPENDKDHDAMEAAYSILTQNDLAGGLTLEAVAKLAPEKRERGLEVLFEAIRLWLHDVAPAAPSDYMGSEIADGVRGQLDRAVGVVALKHASGTKRPRNDDDDISRA